MFSTEDLKTAIGATVIARRNAAARLREAGNPRDRSGAAGDGAAIL